LLCRSLLKDRINDGVVVTTVARRSEHWIWSNYSSTRVMVPVGNLVWMVRRFWVCSKY
jgi:hypothetical protein